MYNECLSSLPLLQAESSRHHSSTGAGHISPTPQSTSPSPTHMASTTYLHPTYQSGGAPRYNPHQRRSLQDVEALSLMHNGRTVGRYRGSGRDHEGELRRRSTTCLVRMQSSVEEWPVGGSGGSGSRRASAMGSGGTLVGSSGSRSLSTSFTHLAQGQVGAHSNTTTGRTDPSFFV